MPSQQSSLRGTRTALMCQPAMTVIEASSEGPSMVRAPPPVHMYSLPARLTPSSRMAWPPAMSWLPDTVNAGGAASAVVRDAVNPSVTAISAVKTVAAVMSFLTARTPLGARTSTLSVADCCQGRI